MTSVLLQSVHEDVTKMYTLLGWTHRLMLLPKLICVERVIEDDVYIFNWIMLLYLQNWFILFWILVLQSHHYIIILLYTGYSLMKTDRMNEVNKGYINFWTKKLENSFFYLHQNCQDWLTEKYNRLVFLPVMLIAVQNK